ncbi:hypothetical protein [Pseudogemmobacter humi]|uniref:Uncharacterized protein n=1 Tax=Pseudogemmobacter humi TaxID=2483812 RepID=A0A3P5XG89_9RHOB|nr:hypothetical protein [Pseudogemmobacter humi]VDC33791.1 hypothetical protein XINFAN_04031 [Pseudogemmobacter humi]
MTKFNPNQTSHLSVGFDQLSKGIDKILVRWPTGERPSKLTLLNDLAEAIRPGSNWGALKALKAAPAPTVAQSNAELIPYPATSSVRMPARLTPVAHDEDGHTLLELTESLRPLFSMSHRNDPIIGLDLTLTDGNGFISASIYSRLILLHEGRTRSVPVFAHDMDAETVALIFGAIQEIELTELYPVLTQAGNNDLRIILGPCQSIGAFPEPYSNGGSAEHLGLRVLFDEEAPPGAADLDVLLRLASVATPHLSLKQFPANKQIQFRLTQPLTDIWAPTDFEIPANLDDRPVFLLPGAEGWVRDSDRIFDVRIHGHSKLGEALDLALTLINIDDPDIVLHAAVTSEPKRLKQGVVERAGWRGGFHKDWRVLRVKSGRRPEILRLEPALRARLEAGFNGWAARDGFKLVEAISEVEAEALIPRNRRRATHHLKQVEAIMHGADPMDKELMQTLGR